MGYTETQCSLCHKAGDPQVCHIPEQFCRWCAGYGPDWDSPTLDQSSRNRLFFLLRPQVLAWIMSQSDGAEDGGHWGTVLKFL